MSNFRFELNSKGVRDLLKSEAMMSVVSGHANDIAGRAGDGYEVSEYTGRNRVNASVRTKSYQAVKDNNKNNTLLKAVR